MKKISYNNKPVAELTADLAALRATVRDASAKAMKGKNTSGYRVARKNIARVMTALTAAKAADSTNAQK